MEADASRSEAEGHARLAKPVCGEESAGGVGPRALGRDRRAAASAAVLSGQGKAAERRGEMR